MEWTAAASRHGITSHDARTYQERGHEILHDSLRPVVPLLQLIDHLVDPVGLEQRLPGGGVFRKSLHLGGHDL